MELDKAKDAGIEQLRQELRSLQGRDLQLWSIGLLITVVVAAGFVALLLPNLMWNLGELRLQGRYLPQLIFGFVTLIVLFNIYAVQQRRTLQNTREELVGQLLRSEAAEKLSLVDPLTEVFSRRFLAQALAQEVSRTDRRGTSLALLLSDIEDFNQVNMRFGHLTGDKILAEVARLLKSTLRASDTVLRYGGDEFLILMGDTTEAQAEAAFRRVLGKVERWNRENPMEDFKLSLSHGIAAYTGGIDATGVLSAAENRMYQNKLQRSPAA